MSDFLRLLEETNKSSALLSVLTHLRHGESDSRHFEVAPTTFDVVPGKAFAYWASDAVLGAFVRYPAFEVPSQREARVGLQTSDDFRFLRLWWEVNNEALTTKWYGFAKGGAASKFYSDIYLLVNWGTQGTEIKSWASSLYDNSHWSRIIKNVEYYLRPGLTWPRRTQVFGPRILQGKCIFADKGPAAFTAGDSALDLLTLLAVMSSRSFSALVELRLNAADKTARSFEAGIIQETPVPILHPAASARLATLARRSWGLKRALDTVVETSHAFVAPMSLRKSGYDPLAAATELIRNQEEIDLLTFAAYQIAPSDLNEALEIEAQEHPILEDGDDELDADIDSHAPDFDAILSWAVGVAFGRFDWRLAVGKRAEPAEPGPFDPLPAKSPGMLPDGDEPFHAHAGILVDDVGHPHDIAQLVEEVYERVDMHVSDDARSWLQRRFFPFHLQRYSKSRRRAPIYWPLSTPSGSYTLWIYYPSVSSQTLYTAVNDFVEPKLKQLRSEMAILGNKGAHRSRDEERQFERFQTLEQELVEMRDALLEIAPNYHPNQDDGVQITAAPLWPLFRYKPWQKILTDTWVKLEKGDYDWAHLAMSYWPDRVREKCKTDKSIAIAHDLETLYVEPVSKSTKSRRRKTKSAT
jgi:hypothetical protein